MRRIHLATVTSTSEERRRAIGLIEEALERSRGALRGVAGVVSPWMQLGDEQNDESVSWYTIYPEFADAFRTEMERMPPLQPNRTDTAK
jgi:hypothetical protein